MTSGSEASDLVRGWGDFEADDLPFERLGALRPNALRLTEEVGFDG